MADHAGDFNLDDPQLPSWVRKAAMRSGGYPYDGKLDESEYGRMMQPLQLQLVTLQAHLQATGGRVLILFEGRDAAGKGGAINAYHENLNPRFVTPVALPKPNDREISQWYFQRYVDWLPVAKETVLFDRSWYNRAGVELVMGFCAPEQTDRFLAQVPRFEQLLVEDGIVMFKFWLDIGREMQMKRFHERRHDPLKSWKLTSIDDAALARWQAYSEARDAMLAATDSDWAPWTVVRANDKRRARLAIIQTVLDRLDYTGKDPAAIGAIDRALVMRGGEFLKQARD